MVRIKKAPRDRNQYRDPVMIPNDYCGRNPDSFAFELNLPQGPEPRRVPSKNRPRRTGALCP